MFGNIGKKQKRSSISFNDENYLFDTFNDEDDPDYSL
jgi:hypothetical protein